ncbi:MAG: hypothetical protein NUW00_03520 [Candidatus Kaiserbacteria bacterium]|nr:hypothetical protein [Candidatus Kaiserbacteria bacterium]
MSGKQTPSQRSTSTKEARVRPTAEGNVRSAVNFPSAYDYLDDGTFGGKSGQKSRPTGTQPLLMARGSYSR